MAETIEDLIDSLENFYEFIDKKMRYHLPQLGKPSCSTCTHESPGCCSQKLAMPVHEALPIVRFIKERKLDTPELRAKLRELGPAMEGSSSKEWFDARKPCVFLDGGRCSIYKARPTHCRLHFVMSDAANCQPDSPDDNVALVDINPLLDQLVARTRSVHLAMGLKDTSQRAMFGAMPRVLLIVLEAFDQSSADKFRDYIRAQVWPSDETLINGWNDGNNPFRVS